MPLPTRTPEPVPHPVQGSPRLEAAPAVLTGLATVALFFSIAVAQIFLGAALLTLLLTPRPLRIPTRFGLALAGFLGWTLLSLAFSRDVWNGLPQLRKLFVFLAFVVAYNAFTHRRQLWRVAQGIALGGAASAIYGLGQFVLTYGRITGQGLPFYENYVLHQITGFLSHWMTFSGQLMMVLLLAVAGALFGGLSRKMRLGAWLCAGVAGLALLAAFTRGIWLGAFAGLVYLLGRSSPRRLLFLPGLLLALYLLAPAWLQRRSESIFQPTNFDPAADAAVQSRVVMFWTGLNMIAAHPLFGVGPQQVEAEFLRYRPPEMPLPRGWYGHLHSNYLQIAAERGIPCLLFLLWMIFEAFRAGLFLARGPTAEARILGQSAVAVTIGLMVSGLFEFNLGDSEVLTLYLVLTAVPFAWARIEQEALSASLSPEPFPASLPGPGALPQTP
ncbi:MAG: O-antigen ligase family protein [Terriglobia bacterium]